MAAWCARKHDHEERLAREAASLRDDVVALVSCRPGCRTVGRDGFLHKLKPFFAPDVAGLTALKITTATGRLTVVTAPGEMFDPTKPFRRQLFSLRDAARSYRLSVVVAPKKVIRLQPRLSNARLLRRCGALKVDEATRATLVAFVSASHSPTAERCACRVDGPNTIDLVFSLVAHRILRPVERGRIGPASRLELVDRHAS